MSGYSNPQSDFRDAIQKSGVMKNFRLHWRDGVVEIVEGADVADAFRRAGIGAGALPALDYWEELS